MIILHTADWHLGKRLDTHSRLAEQRLVMEEIVQVADSTRAQVILIAGDLFDQYHPGNDADELYYRTLSQLSDQGRRAVVVIAGNHDSPDHILAPEALARSLGIITIGLPNQTIQPFTHESGLALTRSAPGFIELSLPDEPPLRIITTPYANAIRLKTALDPDDPGAAMTSILTQHWKELGDTYCDSQGCNLFMGHFYFAIDPAHPDPEPDDEKPILYSGGVPALPVHAIPPQIQYAALGHLHRPHQVSAKGDLPVVYSGSPLSYSFSEAHQQKKVVIIRLEPGEKALLEYYPLQSGFPLLRHTNRDIDAAVQYLQEHQEAFIELTMICPEFLSSEWKSRLEQAHPRVMIIPEIEQLPGNQTPDGHTIQLDHIDDVFKAYFQYKLGAEPDEALMDLFHELLNEDAS
ncbi:MAG: exonuclease subunit SbcD [Saprospiraceae bacterium]|nr:exonuclease subunit SbcD [Saprospiraceae bacterium]